MSSKTVTKFSDRRPRILEFQEKNGGELPIIYLLLNIFIIVLYRIDLNNLNNNDPLAPPGSNGPD